MYDILLRYTYYLCFNCTYLYDLVNYLLLFSDKTGHHHCCSMAIMIPSALKNNSIIFKKNKIDSDVIIIVYEHVNTFRGHN